MKPETAIVASNPAIRRVRAMKMLEMRVAGHTMDAIAAEFNCHPDTVARNLDWAAREGLLQKTEEDIISKLVPEAIRVYTDALAKNNDTFVAKDVLTHAMKIADRLAARKEHEEDLSLNAWLKTRKDRLDDKAAASGEGPSRPKPAVIDITPLPPGPPDPGSSTDG